VRVVLQRVSRAEVRVDGRTVGRVGGGLLLLVGFRAGDGRAQIDWVADKVLGLRVFRDEQDKMNRALDEVGGDVLVVSQFTLYGDVAKGRRPSFVEAAPPEAAKALYEEFVSVLRSKTSRAVETGEFGAMMEVDFVNDGPVTLVIDRDS
jgi:D-tyrosyl-tRNA(Tyr) deacylase